MTWYPRPLWTLVAVAMFCGTASADPLLTFSANAASGKNDMSWDGHAHGETVHGHTAQVSGSLAGNPQDIQDQPHMQLQADLASMDTGNRSRDSTMRGPGCLDTGKYPSVSWTLKRIVQTSSNTLAEGRPVTLQAIGDLTLHGITKETPVQATLILQNGSLHVGGTLDVNLTDFDIRPPSFLFFKMDNAIHITLDITGEPKK